ncbi:MAG TPA: phosphatidylserine/phosphatidylglycerophosphate/cardiolipin synthase family protein [Ktedonobacteraceae bacterium]|nr:phosphatidylserine/phosphatidylglycerophosphate/cardiolipin synthase family protein [Ktedonobacteraceae bacterium]
MTYPLLLWSALALLAALLVFTGTIVIVDARRRRSRSQGPFPYMYPAPLKIGDSEVQVYTYGEDLYDAMLQAIKQAHKRIVFETFIWKDDRIGQRFKQELQDAAARGVDVYIIFDGFANLVVPRRFKRFAPSPNLHVLKYPLLSWPWHPLHLRSYARDHRKILVVDGQTAFVGGYNIGTRYATEWRDTHVRITGPAAWEVENVFIDFWNMHRKRRLPELADLGTRDWDPRIVINRNDPQLMIFPIRATYLEAIDRAQHHVYLTHAYFIPDRTILQGLLKAAARGVDVRILIPESSNHPLADWLARGYYRQCLEGGIRLLLYQNAMVHAKTATIDGIWSTVGTANLDRLSLVGNFEVNVEFYDELLAKQMEAIFLNDASNTHELTLEEWQRRPLRERFAETMLLPLRPLL